MEKKRIKKVLDILSALYPQAHTALRYENAFELLVAAVLSAQCTDQQVNKITASLFKKYKTPEDFAALAPEELAQEIKGCGLYQAKSKNIVNASRILVEKYSSLVPQSRKELEQLPGVGRKTAGVILNIAFGQDTIPVDTHVFRVARRLGLAKGKTPQKVEAELEACIPQEKKRITHHLLIAHGRTVCIARKPKCPECSTRDHCFWVKGEASKGLGFTVKYS